MHPNSKVKDTKFGIWRFADFNATWKPVENLLKVLWKFNDRRESTAHWL